MTDLQWLYAVLVFLYLLECGVWLRHGTLAWVRGWGRGWRLCHPSSLLGNARGGLVLASPLPPGIGAVLTGSAPALSCGEGGLLTTTSNPLLSGPRPLQSGRFFGWDGLSRCSVRGKRVIMDDVVLARCSSQAEALAQRDWLRRLANAAPGERTALAADWCASAFDSTSLKKRWEEFQIVARPLAWYCAVYFVTLFGVMPLVVSRWGLSLTWPLLLVLLGGLAALTTLAYGRAHRRLYPDGDEDRFTQILMILLSPPLAVRALEWLGRPLFEAWHPLTLAVVFGRRDEVSQLARRLLKHLKCPVPPAIPVDHAQAAEVDLSWRQLQEKAVRRLLRTCDLDPAALLQPPKALDPSCRSFCPRCDAQFTTATGECRDCGGTVLQPLPQTPPSPGEARG